MKIQKQHLQKALELVKPGLATKDVIEQTTSFAFINELVVTFNDEISMSHPIPDLSIEGAVQADELYALLSKLKKDEIELELKESEILITSGKTEVGLTLQKEIKLPLDSISKKGSWKPLHSDFLKFTRLAMGSCGSDMSKPLLTCVHVHEEGIIEGSDGMKIMRCELEEKSPIKSFLLPARIATHVVNLKPTYIAEGEGWVHFKTEEGTELSCRTFEDPYPNTDEFMEMDGIALVLPKTFNEMLERASVFSKRDHILDEAINVSIANRKIKIQAKSKSGWIKEDANIRYNEDPVAFSIAPYLLRDILNETQECEIAENRLKFQGEGWQYVTLLFEQEDDDLPF